jgi:hypothetical protein
LVRVFGFVDVGIAIFDSVNRGELDNIILWNCQCLRYGRHIVCNDSEYDIEQFVDVTVVYCACYLYVPRVGLYALCVNRRWLESLFLGADDSSGSFETLSELMGR